MPWSPEYQKDAGLQFERYIFADHRLLARGIWYPRDSHYKLIGRNSLELVFMPFNYVNQRCMIILVYTTWMRSLKDTEGVFSQVKSIMKALSSLLKSIDCHDIWVGVSGELLWTHITMWLCLILDYSSTRAHASYLSYSKRNVRQYYNHCVCYVLAVLNLSLNFCSVLIIAPHSFVYSASDKRPVS